jgi:hypothetical protein
VTALPCRRPDRDAFSPPSLLLHRRINNITSDRATLPIAQFLAALRFVTKDPSYDLQDAECICVSLLDQVRLLSAAVPK